jgi:hypothetical protein
MKSNIVQVNFKVQHDWSKLITIYKKIIDHWTNNKLHNQVYLKEINTYQYDLGSLGALTVLDDITPQKKKGSASFLHGSIVETNLPWIQQLQNDLSPINLSSVCVFNSNQNITSHTDRSRIIGKQNEICKLNLFMADSDSQLHIENNGQVESVTAVANQAWLLNVVNPHWATIPQDLFLFQLSFNKPFDQVIEWFKDKEFNYQS